MNDNDISKPELNYPPTTISDHDNYLKCPAEYLPFISIKHALHSRADYFKHIVIMQSLNVSSVLLDLLQCKLLLCAAFCEISAAFTHLSPASCHLYGFAFVY